MTWFAPGAIPPVEWEVPCFRSDVLCLVLSVANAPSVVVVEPVSAPRMGEIEYTRVRI